jgi:FtsP/CotA-like multicopper oxidase with cupredoxin domain
MGKTIKNGGLALLVAVLLSLSPRAAAAKIIGSTGTRSGPTGQNVTFNLVAAPRSIITSDGDTMFMWLYGESASKVQYPGPTLIIKEGDNVTIRLRSLLPAPLLTSMVLPGQSVTASGGSSGLLTREAANGVTVTYKFTASKPGTYLYHSGTRPDLQVEMGLMGAIVVRPAGYSDSDPTTWRAYGDASAAYDREYLFFLSDADPLIHQQVAFGDPIVDMTTRRAVDWFINGRNFPDTMSDASVDWLPAQPYNAFPQMHPGERVLMRIIGGGVDLHPFHTHGQNHLVIARDGRVLSSNPAASSPTADMAVSDYTTTSIPGETVDAIWGPWTGANLGWDVYGPADLHTCNGLTVPSAGFDPQTHEFCEDHGKPFPVTLPPETYLAFGPMYGGTPFLGISGSLPILNPDGTVHVQKNPNAGLSFMWHSHSERELTTNDIFIGGMATMALVLPVGAPITQ